MDIEEFIEQMKKFEMLTEKRIELMTAIIRYKPSSIRELADEIDRDIKNVFDDLKILQELDFVDFVCEGRRKRPIVKKKKIIIKLG